MKDYMLIDEILRMQGVRKIECTNIFNEELEIEFLEIKVYFKNTDRTEYWSKRIQVQRELLYSNPREVYEYVMKKLSEEPVSTLLKGMLNSMKAEEEEENDYVQQSDK